MFRYARRSAALMAVCTGAVLLFAAPLPAEDVSVTATVDKTEATMEDTIVLRVSVKGARSEPQVGRIPGFSVTSRGSSSQVSIVNGRMSASVEYTYLLYPQKQGTYTIGPFYVENDGSRIESNRISVTVAKGSSASGPSRDVFITAAVSNEKPYLYEQIVYTLSFYRKVKVANAGLTETPSFEGFLAEEAEKEKQYEKVINGQNFVVTEIRQVLFPIKTGVHEIEPAALQCDVVVGRRRTRRGLFDDPFFGFAETVPKRLRTSPITVMVQQLPESGKPQGFSNLVGDFSLSAEIGTTKLHVGDSATLTVTLSGAGNLKNQQDIDLAIPDNFKAYDDKPVFAPSVHDGMAGGTLTIKKAIVPLVPGTLKIPAFSVPYFHPSSGTYRTASAGPFILEALPAEEKEQLQIVAPAQAPAKEKIKIIGRDILPIHTSLNKLSRRAISPFSFMSLSLLLAPPLIFTALYVSVLLHKRRQGEVAALKSRTAYKSFKKNLSDIEKNMTDSGADYYKNASRAFKNFIRDRFSAPVAEPTVRDLDRLLADAGVSCEERSRVSRIMHFFDEGQFGVVDHALEEKQAIVEEMKACAKTLKNAKL